MKKLLPKTLNNPQGFTLIELMVVVSIIAFLAVIGVAAFSNAQKTARDGRRRADIEAIAAALESNRDTVVGKYQPSSDTAVTTILSTDTNATFNGYFSSGKAPTDPTNTGTSIYTTKIATKGVSFITCTVLENGGGNSSDLGTFDSNNNVTFTTGTANFCIRSRQ